MSTLYEPLLNLIKTNKNWKQFLKAEPRFITIKQCPWTNNESLIYPELYMLSYDGILSDFNDKYVQLCRGCVVSLKDPNNPIMVVAPFTKFGNYGQSFCPEIDWASALVEQKVDGILIKLFYYGNKWHWITNNGWNTNLPWKEIIKIPSKYTEIETNTCNTIQDLINYCLIKNNVNLNEFRPDYTYMFELISPKMRILVDNPQTDLIYLGCRNNINYNELQLEIAKAAIPVIKKFNTVKYFDLHNIDEVLQLCNSYKGDTDEGVVVVDDSFNRVKIKSPAYLALHHAWNNGNITDCDILTIGQYIRPSKQHLEVEKYYRLDEYDYLREKAKELGFNKYQIGPLVRSSYHAKILCES